MSNIRSFNGRVPRIAGDVWVDPAAVVIGDVEIGPESSIWPWVVIRGDVHFIRIGSRTSIQDGSVLHVSHDSRYAPGGHSLIVGDGVTVGHQCTLHGCEIQNFCLIGIGSRVLDGAVLEPKVMLGAGSLVTPGKVLEGGHLWVGSPARKVRALTADELEYLEYSAAHYVRLAGRHRAPQNNLGSD